METKKKILVLMPHYLPGNKLGGPVASISNIINSLCNDIEFSIITSDRDLGDKQSYNGIEAGSWLKRKDYYIYYLHSNYLILYYLIKQVKKYDFDILYLNSFFEPRFSILIMIANKLGILNIKNIILAPRGEFMDGCLEIKPMKKRLFIWLALKFNLYKNVIWHASTESEAIDIRKVMKVSNNMVKVALNISKIDDVDDSLIDLNFKKELNTESHDLRIIFLSRISREKNLNYAINILKDVKLNILFDIYGPIEDSALWDSCLEKIKKLPSNIIVNYKGTIQRDEVKKTFRQYELFFFPTVGENFAHVIVESLLAGTPVLISDRTPWKNLEVDGLGWDISLENPNLFIEAIYKMAFHNDTLKNREEIVKTFTRRIKDPAIYLANKQLFTHSFKPNE